MTKEISTAWLTIGIPHQIPGKDGEDIIPLKVSQV
jgi:hypothetical protein